MDAVLTAAIFFPLGMVAITLLACGIVLLADLTVKVTR